MSQPPKSMELQRRADNGNSNDIKEMHTSMNVAQFDEHKDIYMTQQADYTCIGTVDQPNEYEVVKNHRSTTVQEEMGEPEDTDYSSGCSGRFCLWIKLCVLLIFFSLVAIAALVLGIAALVLALTPVCNCAASPEQVQELINRIQVLENGEIELMNRTQALENEEIEFINRIQALENGEIVTGSNISLLTQRLDTLSFTAELVGFEPYAECVTSYERICIISAQGQRCETPDLDYIMADDPALNYTRDAQCLQLPFSLDRQHLSTTLVIQNNIIFCVCERIVVQPAIAVIETSCGLQVTRCRSNRNVPVEIVTTSNAQLGNN